MMRWVKRIILCLGLCFSVWLGFWIGFRVMSNQEVSFRAIWKDFTHSSNRLISPRAILKEHLEKVSPGMTALEVKKILGEPKDIHSYRGESLDEAWYYDLSLSEPITLKHGVQSKIDHAMISFKEGKVIHVQRAMY